MKNKGYAGVKFQQIDGGAFFVEFAGDFPPNLEICVKNFANFAIDLWREIQALKGVFGSYKTIPEVSIEVLFAVISREYLSLQRAMEESGWEPTLDPFRPTWHFMGPEDSVTGGRPIAFCSFSGACWFKPTEKD